MARALLALVAAAAAAAVTAQQSNPLVVSVNPDGSYSLSAGPTFPSFSLNGASTGLTINGAFVSNKLGTLNVSRQDSFTGTDAWGDYSAVAVTWASPSLSPAMITTFRTYVDVPAVVFETAFPSALNNPSGNRDGIQSSFPAFEIPGTSALGFAQWRGPFVDGGSIGPAFGRFQSAGLENLISGLQGGPIAFYDQSGQGSVVVGPASQFMAVNPALNSGRNEFGWGVLASATSIPPWYSVETVAWYGSGLNQAMMGYGAALLAKYNKRHGLSVDDYTNTHLGYNTDHGAYYYYTTANYSNYSTALSAVAQYAAQVGIPYKHVLLDSWWYYKGVGDGVKNWTAMTSVFTGGNDGIRALVEQTGWKIIAHNRYWSTNTDYARANGGDFDFFIDPKGQGNQMAVPLEQRFWDYLLTDSVKEWGLTTYEQDWLYNELEGVTALTTNLTLARQWMLQMGAGAETAGVTVQLCMAYPRHALQTVEMPTATQIRASDDHVPGEGYYPLQWRMGFSSILAWSVGLAPFKDNYWSTSKQPGGSCGNSIETSPGLHGAISTFSAGPVTPGDGVGYSDVGMIMRSCNSYGKLLHPSRPLTALDSEAVGKSFPGAPNTTAGEVYATYSYVSGWAWDHVLAADLNSSYTVSTSDISAIRGDIPMRQGAGVAGLRLLSSEEARTVGSKTSDQGRVAYTLDATTLAPSTLVVQPFDDANGITVQACKEADFQIWHTAPVFANGWALLGELTKWVPVAPARVQSVTLNGGDLVVRITGQAGEAVPLTFYNAAGANTTTVTCTVADSGSAAVVMPYGICNTA